MGYFSLTADLNTLRALSLIFSGRLDSTSKNKTLIIKNNVFFYLPISSPDILALTASSYPLEWDSPAPPVALQAWAMALDCMVGTSLSKGLARSDWSDTFAGFIRLYKVGKLFERVVFHISLYHFLTFQLYIFTFLQILAKYWWIFGSLYFTLLLSSYWLTYRLIQYYAVT